jgi:hypothetical protein
MTVLVIPAVLGHGSAGKASRCPRAPPASPALCREYGLYTTGSGLPTTAKPSGHSRMLRPNVRPWPAAGRLLLPLTAGLLLWIRTRRVHTTHRYLRRETRQLSIRAFPKNSLLCQGNPDEDPGSPLGRDRGSLCNADPEQGQASYPQS